MGPIWGRQDPGGPMLAPWTLLSGILFSVVSPIIAQYLTTTQHNTTKRKAYGYFMPRTSSYEECCARSRYQGLGQIITSHSICGIYLFLPLVSASGTIQQSMYTASRNFLHSRININYIPWNMHTVCCAMFCCCYVSSSFIFVWFINPYFSGLIVSPVIARYLTTTHHNKA